MSGGAGAWRRLLVLGNDADAVAERVRGGAPELDVTARTLRDARAEDGAGVEMLLAFRVPEALAAGLADLRWVQSVGAGVDGILGGPLGARSDVLVTRVLDVFGGRMAEYVLARCLAIAQQMPRLQQDKRAKRWSRSDPHLPRMLASLTIAVVGTGEIGAEIARTLGRFGPRVLGVNRSGRPVPDIAEVFAAERLHDALGQADVVVLVVPATEATRRLIGAAELARMKPDAWLVNVARGSVVDEAALCDALRARRIGGAALDVFETEPLPADSPLWELDDVLISPHVSGLTTSAEAADAFLDNWNRLRRGAPPRGLVDRARGY